MFGPYVHKIDPILFDIARGSLLVVRAELLPNGFLEIHLFLRRGHGRLRLSLRDVWCLSLLMGIGVLEVAPSRSRSTSGPSIAGISC